MFRYLPKMCSITYKLIDQYIAWNDGVIGKMGGK